MLDHLTIVTHPLVQHKLTIMRNKDTSTAGFRRLLREISLLLAYEVTRDLDLTTISIETPLCTMEAPTLDGKKCYMLISQLPKTINSQKIELQSIQYLIPTTRGIAFVVTFTTKASTFEQQKAGFLAAANSIRTEAE